MKIAILNTKQKNNNNIKQKNKKVKAISSYRPHPRNILKIHKNFISNTYVYDSSQGFRFQENSGSYM